MHVPTQVHSLASQASEGVTVGFDGEDILFVCLFMTFELSDKFSI